MEIKIYKDYHELSESAANEIIDLVKNKPSAVLCLASGHTPKLTCDLLVEKALKQKIDFSQVNFIGLDEWVGIPPANEGSCHYFFQTRLFNHLNFSKEKIHLFNALSGDLDSECKKMDATIFNNGGTDLILVGIGMNGHIGFNEPGASFSAYSHLAELDEVTTSVGQKYFKEATALGRGITLGLKHLYESKKVLLQASGDKKSAIIKKALQGEVTNQIPASIIQTIPQAIAMLDKDAAASLDK